MNSLHFNGLGKEAFNERLEKFRQLTTAKNATASVQPYVKRSGDHVLELKKRYENLSVQIPTLTVNTVSKSVLAKQISTTESFVPTVIAPQPQAISSLLETIETLAEPIQTAVSVANQHKEYPDYKIERNKTPNFLEKLYAKFMEKNSENKSKCKSGYYLSFQNGEYEWKRMSHFPKLAKAERKELRIALENLLETLNKVIDQQRLVEFMVDNDTIPLQALLLRIVDYPIETPKEHRVCVHFLNRKKNRYLRQGIIKFIHKCTYYQPVREAQEIKSFLDKSHKNLTSLIEVLSGIQLVSISRETPKIIQLGMEKLQSRVKSAIVHKHEYMAKETLEKYLSNDIISPRLNRIVNQRRQHMAEANETFKALRAGLEDMQKSGKNRFAKDIGVALTYNQFNTSEANDYLIQVLGKPEQLLGCYNEAKPTPLLESFLNYKNFVENYLALHRSFGMSLGIREFLKNSDALPLAKKEKAKKAYRNGEYGECLRIIFHVGGVTLELKSLLKDLARRSVDRLQLMNVSVEIHQDFSKYEWADLVNVFKTLEKEFRNLQIG